MWMWFIRVMGGAVVNRVRFIQGEDKHVKLLVRSPNNEPFTILAASYSLSRFGEVESHGECEIRVSVRDNSNFYGEQIDTLKTNGADGYAGDKKRFVDKFQAWIE